MIYEWPERWRTIPSFPLYQASDRGRIRRNPRRWKNLGPEALKPACSNGYLWVTLKHPGGARRRVYIHRAVCEAFHWEAPTPLHEVAHGDGVKANNTPENLRWATRKENHADKRLHGTWQKGERHPRAILNEDGAAAVRLLTDLGWGVDRIASALRVSRGCVSHIRSGRHWAVAA